MNIKQLYKNLYKKAMIESYVAYWIIGLLFLAIAIGGYIYLRKTDNGAISYIRNMFRFGRGLG